ncbi:MAG: hypothetical protein A2W61_04995 [Deltaproteobacteria bacterium RIFCSPLOWO2_01_44_7]|nr:MAG: hypothetical protein A2712_00565 [Deltaproteobacteria bacterium RIFCSPHIGHO2_01_FULL_43_49]OGQ14232.1 MAG: hypothetical protein A3D22_10050 [Deltaproteobacteria bacterium RIFCSPHIGHO2_02_FULL_44_53]OGQ27448.1 MAG: hypothetical protein A3D98_03650 [Deltaproteobacteria bacterium RIFCSPHIGHO2_12_FULL_44_21]OGQ30696.1 MAG: hypothetical protein A2979_06075 [Deltaproteobacteria bacterium RIFCSPLOWO2_01_FULL_45_74]OGQ41425.1 MAG: hypothetical protein A2W61_04995 [Deltaproteobacteria bacterium 
MLDVMRKHAGWGLKVVLGVIIVTFVFFFGYTQLREGGRDATAIQVGKEIISFSKYRFFYENNYEQMRANFQGQEIPDFLIKNIQNSTQQQLIFRAMMKQFAKGLGIVVSDIELAKKLPEILAQDGELAKVVLVNNNIDPVAYKNFLQGFYLRSGFSYEELIREDLHMKKFQEWAKQQTTKVEGLSKNSQWNFETAILNGEDKQTLAEEIQKMWNKGKEATPLLKKDNIKTEKTGFISISERQKIFPHPLTLDEYAGLFSLTKPKSAPEKPYSEEKNFLVVRLVEKKKSPEKDPRLTPQESASLIDAWYRTFADKTKVKSFISPEEL